MMVISESPLTLDNTVSDAFLLTAFHPFSDQERSPYRFSPLLAWTSNDLVDTADVQATASRYLQHENGESLVTFFYIYMYSNTQELQLQISLYLTASNL